MRLLGGLFLIYVFVYLCGPGAGLGWLFFVVAPLAGLGLLCQATDHLTGQDRQDPPRPPPLPPRRPDPYARWRWFDRDRF